MMGLGAAQGVAMPTSVIPVGFPTLLRRERIVACITPTLPALWLLVTQGVPL